MYEYNKSENHANSFPVMRMRTGYKTTSHDAISVAIQAFISVCSPAKDVEKIISNHLCIILNSGCLDGFCLQRCFIETVK